MDADKDYYINYHERLMKLDGLILYDITHTLVQNNSVTISFGFQEKNNTRNHIMKFNTLISMIPEYKYHKF